LTDLSAQWAMRLDGAGVRSDAAARAVLTHLVRQPVLTARVVSEVLGVSERSSRTALDTLAQLSIVERLDNVAPRGRGRQAQWFVAGEVLALVARR
jgi:predicted ArsR family transcriptional regulator